MTDIVKSTRIRNIESMEDGSLLLHISLLVLEGDAILGSRTHHRRIFPGEDIDAHALAVNDHFAGSGLKFQTPDMLGGGPVSDTVVNYPPLSDADVAKVKARADAEWTPELIAKWDAIREAERIAGEENEARQKAENEAAAAAKVADFKAMAEQLGYSKSA